MRRRRKKVCCGSVDRFRDGCTSRRAGDSFSDGHRGANRSRASNCVAGDDNERDEPVGASLDDGARASGRGR